MPSPLNPSQGHARLESYSLSGALVTNVGSKMGMAYKTYLGIRRVSRLEYLIAFLGSVRDGYDREDARRHIQKILQGVEIEKAKALGKKKARPVSGASLLPECEKMAVEAPGVPRAHLMMELTKRHQVAQQLARLRRNKQPCCTTQAPIWWPD